MSAAIHPASWPAAETPPTPDALWSASEIAAATGGKASAAFTISGIETDSREAKAGDLFLALKGETTDGHRFLDQAFGAGATAALVEHAIERPHVLVPDCTVALAALAKAARERTAARIIGVTGSVGKTGVKEAIFAALERGAACHGGGGAAHRSVKSYNNHVGVPLSLARMPAKSRFGMFEMGMNHAGEIARLTERVRPHVALITTIAPAHIENLGSLEAIADAKAEIFAGLALGGTAIIPADNPQLARLRAGAQPFATRIITFGTSPDADFRLLDTVPAANGGSLVTAAHPAGTLCYTVAEPGAHWVTNSLAVMAAVHAVGGDLGSAGLALAEMGGLAGRGARLRVRAASGHALVIDESYNANPASMRATLGQLGATPAARRIAVLGAMKELGDFGPEFHARLAEPLIEAKVDHAILVGEEMAPLAERLSARLGKSPGRALVKPASFAHCRDAIEAIAALEELGLMNGDAVLVKGSNSVGLARLVAELARRGA